LPSSTPLLTARKLGLNEDVSSETDGTVDSLPDSQSIDPSPRAIYPQDHLIPPSASHPILSTSSSFSDDEGCPSSDEDVPESLRLSTWLLDKSLNPTTPRYFGRSPSGRMVKSAIDMRNHLNGTSAPPTSSWVGEIRARRLSYWQIPPVRVGLASIQYFI
jgi:hypothetical protein